MKTPNIDVSSVPGLENDQGLFGSLSQNAALYDDRIIDLMVYVYDAFPPSAMV